MNVFPSGMHRPAVSGLEQDSPAFDTDIRLFFGAVTRKGFQHPACDHPVEVLLIKRQFAGYVFRYDDGMVSGHLAVIGGTGGQHPAFRCLRMTCETRVVFQKGKQCRHILRHVLPDVAAGGTRV